MKPIESFDDFSTGLITALTIILIFYLWKYIICLIVAVIALRGLGHIVNGTIRLFVKDW